jgi:hypothetical protein
MSPLQPHMSGEPAISNSYNELESNQLLYPLHGIRQKKQNRQSNMIANSTFEQRTNATQPQTRTQIRKKTPMMHLNIQILRDTGIMAFEILDSKFHDKIKAIGRANQCTSNQQYNTCPQE